MCKTKLVIISVLLFVGASASDDSNKSPSEGGGDPGLAESLAEAGRVVEIPSLNTNENSDFFASGRADHDFPSRESEELGNRKDNFVSNFLRMLGMDENHLGNLAMNLLIYIGEMVARNFIGDPSAKNEIPQYRSLVQEEGFVSGMTALMSASSARSQAVKSALLDKSLPNVLIDGLRNRTGDATSCVQLFLCKITPYVWGAQDEASNNSIDFGDSLGSNLRYFADGARQRMPEKEEAVKFGRDCEKRFPGCPLVNF